MALVDHHYGASGLGHALLAHRAEQHPNERSMAAAADDQQVGAVGSPEKCGRSGPLDHGRNYVQAVRVADDAIEGLVESILGVRRGVVPARYGHRVKRRGYFPTDHSF
jgi:hypothetical protein